MGRLMDSIMAAVGLKPSDRVPPLHPEQQQQQEFTTHNSKDDHPKYIDLSSSADCTSCRVIGACTLLGLNGLLVHNLYRIKHRYKGYRLAGLWASGIILTACFGTAAYCRAFSKGPFKTKPDTGR